VTYKLVTIWQDSRRKIVVETDDPVYARACTSRVSYDPRNIARIELHDHEGRLETLWAATWNEGMG
jgi:hypothetical protein